MDNLNLTSLRNTYQDKENAFVEIRKGAGEIRSIRVKNASAIKSAVKHIENGKSSTDGILRDIEEKIGGMTEKACPSDKKERILSSCKSIRSQYEGYYDETQKLASRFEHAKINIIAYGEPGQGKSSFVKHFTHLPDQIVAEHPEGDSRDKTGAMNIYLWDSQYKGDYKVEVVFKTKDVFVKQVIDNLQLLKVEKMNDIDVQKITINNLISWIGSVNNKVTVNGKTIPMNEISGGDMGAKKMIDHVFEKETNLNELADSPNIKVNKPISDIPIYNDMTHKNVRKWMTVEKIIVTKSCKEPDYLKFFEIRDTKGISVQAGGGNAEKDVFDQLVLCDAAFSISMPGGPNTDALSFYNNKVRPFCEKNDAFKGKNFVVCNPFLGEKVKETRDNFISSIGSAAIANTCYDGVLKNGDAEEFVTLLMLDMLKKIVKIVKTEDDRLIAECNKKASSIEKEILDLNNEIQSLDVEPVNVDDFIKDKIDKVFKVKADEEIIEKCFNGNNPLNETISNNSDDKATKGGRDDDDDDDEVYNTHSSNKKTSNGDGLHVVYSDEKYKEVLKDKQTLSVYQLLTNSIKDEKHRDESVSDAVESAIKELWNDINQEKSDKDNFGGVVDKKVNELVQTLEKNTENRIKQTLLEQTKQTVTEMFKVIWNQFYLNKLYGPFDEELFRDMANFNGRVKAWFDIYSEKHYETPAFPFKWFRSYDVLLNYFSNLEKEPISINTKQGNFSNVLMVEKLKKSVLKCIDLGQFRKFIINRSIFLQLEEIYKGVFQQVTTNFQDLKLSEDLLPLYKDKIDKCEEEGIIEDPKNRIKDSELYGAVKHQCSLLFQQGRAIPKIEVNQ